MAYSVILLLSSLAIHNKLNLLKASFNPLKKQLLHLQSDQSSQKVLRGHLVFLLIHIKILTKLKCKIDSLLS